MKTNNAASTDWLSRAGVGARSPETASARGANAEREADWRLSGEGWQWQQADLHGDFDDDLVHDCGDAGERGRNRDHGGEFGAEGWS